MKKDEYLEYEYSRIGLGYLGIILLSINKVININVVEENRSSLLLLAKKQ